MANPMPDDSVRVEKNGSKRYSRYSGSIPTPEVRYLHRLSSLLLHDGAGKLGP